MKWAPALPAFDYEAARGVLTEFQTISTLPEDFHGKNTDAEIAVHPSGKFLYGSNRGTDSITVFSIAPDSGRLAVVEHQSTRGKTPRNFGIDPTGKWLLAANQDSANVVLFRIHAGTGQLEPAGHELKLSAPVCVVFLPLD